MAAVPAPDDHLHAFIDAFVVPRRRPRYHAKPRELLRALCHRLPDELDPRLTVDFGGLRGPGDVGACLTAISPVPTGVYLGAWHSQEIGEYPLAEAVELAESHGGAIVSLQAGQLAYHVSEHPGGTRRLLARDPKARSRATALLTRLHDAPEN
jgi:hypothetical protein